MADVQGRAVSGPTSIELAACLKFRDTVNRVMPADEDADRMAAEVMSLRGTGTFRKIKATR